MPRNGHSDPFRPSNETLLDYVCGALPDADADRVAAAMQADAVLSERVARIEAILAAMRADDSVPATGEAIRRGIMVWSSLGARTRPEGISWVARARRCIAELVFDSRNPLALAGYRSPDATATADTPGDYQLAYASPSGRVDLRVTATGDQWRLRGQVTSADRAELGSVTLLPIESGQVVEAMPDEHGHFCLETMAGRYDLLIELDHGLRAVLAPDLEVGQD